MVILLCTTGCTQLLILIKPLLDCQNCIGYISCKQESSFENLRKRGQFVTTLTAVLTIRFWSPPWCAWTWTIHMRTGPTIMTWASQQTQISVFTRITSILAFITIESRFTSTCTVYVIARRSIVTLTDGLTVLTILETWAHLCTHLSLETNQYKHEFVFFVSRHGLACQQEISLGLAKTDHPLG